MIAVNLGIVIAIRGQGGYIRGRRKASRTGKGEAIWKAAMTW